MLRKIIYKISFAFITLIGAILYMLDTLDIISPKENHWYLYLIAYVALIIFNFALYKKRAIYIVISMLLLSIFFMLLIPLLEKSIKVYQLWPLILIFFGVGIVLGMLYAHNRKEYIPFAIICLVLGIISQFIMIYTDKIVGIPAVIAIMAFIHLSRQIYFLVKKIKYKRIVGNYYVTPTDRMEENDE